MEAHQPFISYFKQNAAHFSNSRIIWLCVEIASAISFLWEQKVVHRDIKLDNFLISSDGIPVLCDFGMAEFVDDNGWCKEGPDSIGGNLAHLAPEVINLWKKTRKPNYLKQPSWELGVICFELAVDSTPFDGYPNGERYIEESTGNISVLPLDTTPLEEVELPQDFIGIIVNLLDNNPTKRMTISQAHEALIGSLENIK